MKYLKFSYIVPATVSLSVESDLPKPRFVDTIKPEIERPHFDDAGPKNITAVVGQSAILHCRVKHPGDRTVRVFTSQLSYNFIRLHNKQQKKNI